MNKTTQKILIIAISAIVVIVATTVALLVVPGMLNKEKETEDDNYSRPKATSVQKEEETEASHTYFPEDFTEPSTEMTTLDSLLASTQNALDPNNKPSTVVPSVQNPAGNNNGGSNKPAGNNNSGSAKPTTPAAKPTTPAAKPTAPVAKPTTPVVPGSTKPSYNNTQSGVNIKDLIDEDGVQVLGYRWSNEGNGYYYTDDKDCWQKNAGYNEVYDQMAPLTAMFIDQVRIRFNYGGKDWMVQLWKGQYGWLLVGAEIGLYTAEEGANTGDINDINHYNCADKEDWLYMSMDMYWAKGNNGHYEKAFSRPYAKYWWPTGFVKGQLTKYTWPRTELKMKGRITFKDEAMADAFVAELKKSGFARAAGSTSSLLADDTYYQEGADIIFLWSTIYHDCFK